MEVLDRVELGNSASKALEEEHIRPFPGRPLNEHVVRSRSGDLSDLQLRTSRRLKRRVNRIKTSLVVVLTPDLQRHTLKLSRSSLTAPKNLDAPRGRKEALNRLGTTVVVATHDVHLLSKVPDSLIMRLDKGVLSDPTGALRYPPRRIGAGE